MAGESRAVSVGCLAVCDGVERGRGEESCQTAGEGGVAGEVSDDQGTGLPVRGDPDRGGHGGGSCQGGRAASADLVDAPVRRGLGGRLAGGARARLLGPRELLEDSGWADEISWRDRRGYHTSSHRPDLVARPSRAGVAFEVELAKKSAARLRAILWHYAIRRSTKGSAVMYVCADDELCQRVRRLGAEVGLTPRGGWLRVELLDTIKAQARAGSEAAKSERLSKPSAAPRPMLAVDGG
jgi:hypothetical protein